MTYFHGCFSNNTYVHNNILQHPFGSNFMFFNFQILKNNFKTFQNKQSPKQLGLTHAIMFTPIYTFDQYFSKLKQSNLTFDERFSKRIDLILIISQDSKKTKELKQNLPQTISFLLTFIHQNYQFVFQNLKLIKVLWIFKICKKPKPLIEGFMIFKIK